VGLTEEEQAATGIGPGTIRVSCGLEDTDDVVADFEAALAAAG
jgi:O-acetylhomoserine/O-acetylserine sulfhydrylase-like pyridoxal-dependent enzyme